jgi:hypothetical protein
MRGSPQHIGGEGGHYHFVSVVRTTEFCCFFTLYILIYDSNTRHQQQALSDGFVVVP